MVPSGSQRVGKGHFGRPLTLLWLPFGLPWHPFSTSCAHLVQYWDPIWCQVVPRDGKLTYSIVAVRKSVRIIILLNYHGLLNWIKDCTQNDILVFLQTGGGKPEVDASQMPPRCHKMHPRCLPDASSSWQRGRRRRRCPLLLGQSASPAQPCCQAGVRSQQPMDPAVPATSTGSGLPRSADFPPTPPRAQGPEARARSPEGPEPRAPEPNAQVQRPEPRGQSLAIPPP